MENKPILSIEEIEQQEKELAVSKRLLIEKSLKSEDPQQIVKAQAYVTKEFEKVQSKQQTKSFLFDPYFITGSLGYKEKNISLSYDTLRRMSKAPIIKSIIGTRIDQVVAFCEPQKDDYSPGFVVRNKTAKKGKTASPEDEKMIKKITDFIINCGENRTFDLVSFDSFTRKFIKDSLELDQATFERIKSRNGKFNSFIATDAATFRFADHHNRNFVEKERNERRRNELPAYVQVLQSQIVAEFWKDELCFAIRNPQTTLHQNSYGTSELEDLILTVTAMLFGDQYNRNFFSQGSAPKGLLKVKGNVPENKLDAFREQWLSQVVGTSNSWKTPIINADELDWVDLQKTNRDMEFSKYQEYLIKVACAVYKISPFEIGFDIQGASSGNKLGGASNEYYLRYSKEKGLKPLLKFYERIINRFILPGIEEGSENYELIFVGMDDNSPEKEAELDAKILSSGARSLEEVRAMRGLGKQKETDTFLNPVYQQALANKMAQQQQQQMQGNVDDGFIELGGDEDSEDDNPFTKALEESLANMV